MSVSLDHLFRPLAIGPTELRCRVVSPSHQTTLVHDHLPTDDFVWEASGRDPAEFELKHLPSFEVDVQRRWPSVEKAKRLLGWEARVGLEEGIANTVSWLRDQERVAG